MRTVIEENGFAADVVAQARMLAAEGEWDRLRILGQDLDNLVELLTRFPDAGRELDREGGHTLRKLRLRRVPFYVWYRTADGEDTWLLRLFHVRQRTPRPRMR